MHIHDLILLVVSKEEEQSLRGRTLLQKKLYFLSMLKRVDFGFRPHYYGPYSSWVAENLDTLVGIGFLKEMTETVSGKGKNLRRSSPSHLFLDRTQQDSHA